MHIFFWLTPFILYVTLQLTSKLEVQTEEVNRQRQETARIEQQISDLEKDLDKYIQNNNAMDAEIKSLRYSNNEQMHQVLP